MVSDIKHLTMETFSEVQKPGLKAVVVVSSEHCPTAEHTLPLIPEAESLLPEISFFMIDAVKEPILCEALGVKGLPTYLFMDSGGILQAKVGIDDMDTLVHYTMRYLF
jgi:hypothetical protein